MRALVRVLQFDLPNQSRHGVPTTYQVTLVTLGKILQRLTADLNSVEMMLVREGRRLAELGAGQSFFFFRSSLQGSANVLVPIWP